MVDDTRPMVPALLREIRDEVRSTNTRLDGLTERVMGDDARRPKHGKQHMNTTHQRHMNLHFNIAPSTTPSGIPLCSSVCAYLKDRRCTISSRFTSNDEVCRPAVENMECFLVYFVECGLSNSNTSVEKLLGRQRYNPLKVIGKE